MLNSLELILRLRPMGHISSKHQRLVLKRDYNHSSVGKLSTRIAKHPRRFFFDNAESRICQAHVGTVHIHNGYSERAARQVSRLPPTLQGRCSIVTLRRLVFIFRSGKAGLGRVEGALRIKTQPESRVRNLMDWYRARGL